jgi:predicted TIM-barrel fold metal-dependent hydrolase
MLLSEFAPRTSLRLAATSVDRPAVPVIDSHNHLGPDFGGEWATRSVAAVTDALDEAGVETVVDLDGGQGDGLSERIERYQAAYPTRIRTFAGLAYPEWSNTQGFGEMEARRLEDSAARGASGLKVWKVLGLRARDPAGRLVGVDDPRLEPVWETAGRLGLPVVVHVADPIAFFEPLDEHNERWEELRAHPDWHFWPTTDTASAADREPAFPPFDAILAALDRLLGRHPGTTFIGAHVGCAAEDLSLVGSMLDRHPNFLVDIAARIAELGRQPYTARRFFLEHQDRILFGTDLGFDAPMYRLHYRFLETFDESFDYSTDPVPPQGRWQIHGLGLPAEVLRRVYRENALRVLGGPASPAGRAA